MPYDSVADLPPTVQKYLPSEARVIFLIAFNDAWYNQDLTEQECFITAWRAVKKKFEKFPKTGMWLRIR